MYYNKVLLVTFVAWFTAQALKFLIDLIKYKKVDLAKFISSGGMPSSHSSLVTSLATSIGFVEGFDSSIFALATGIACIVMYDASGVRRAVGKQARILNKMIEDIHQNKFEAERLKELIGHTPTQVYLGGLLGIGIALLFFR